MLGLHLVAQQAAAPAAHAADQPQRGEAGKTVGADAPAAIDAPVEKAGELRPRLDEAAEPGRHGAAELLDARVEIFGHLQDGVVVERDLAAHTGTARRARLQVGDADHVVVAHGVGDMLRRGDRQRVAMAASSSATAWSSRSRYSAP